MELVSELTGGKSGLGNCFCTTLKERKVNYWSANDFHLINFQVRVIEKAINRSDKANENRKMVNCSQTLKQIYLISKGILLKNIQDWIKR